MMARIVRYGLIALFLVLFGFTLVGGAMDLEWMPWLDLTGYALLTVLVLWRSWIAFPLCIAMLVLAFEHLMIVLYATQPGNGATLIILACYAAPALLLAWLVMKRDLPNPRFGATLRHT